MTIKTIIVVSSVLVASATLAAQAQQGGRGGAPKIFTSPGLDLFVTRPIEGRVVKGMPYSAEMSTESIQTLGDGNRIVHRSAGRVYRDTDGRVRREEDRGTNASIMITDPVANKSFALDPTTRTARETPGLRILNGYFTGLQVLKGQKIEMTPFSAIGGGRGARGSATASGTQADTTIVIGRGGRGGRTADAGSEAVEEPLPNRTIEGVVASGVRRTTTIPAGAVGNEQPIKIVSEEWTSVDLQVLVLTDLNDPRAGHSTYRLTNINRSNPDPALFKVPGDYTMQPAGGRGRGGRP
jgi:hypothetical protein